MKKNKTIAFFILLLAQAAVLIYFHDRFWSAVDEGQFAIVAHRVNQGEVLFRDLHDAHPGYIHWLNALAMRAFGEDLVSLRYPVVFIFFVGGCLVFLLFSAQSLWLAVAAGLCPAVLSFVHYLGPSHHWYALFFTVLIAVVLSHTGLERRRQAFGVGIFAATVFLFRQLTGVFVFMAVISFFLLEASEKRKAKLILKDALLFYVLSGMILIW